MFSLLCNYLSYSSTVGLHLRSLFHRCYHFYPRSYVIIYYLLSSIDHLLFTHFYIFNFMACTVFSFYNVPYVYFRSLHMTCHIYVHNWVHVNPVMAKLWTPPTACIRWINNGNLPYSRGEVVQFLSMSAFGNYAIIVCASHYDSRILLVPVSLNSRNNLSISLHDEPLIPSISNRFLRAFVKSTGISLWPLPT